MAIFSAVMPCRWRTQGPQAVPWCHKLGVCRTLCCRSWKSIGNGYELYFVTKTLTEAMRNSYCMFHCYNIITTYSVVVLANKGVTDSSGGEGQITTSPSCTGRGRRGVTEELKYALVSTDRLNKSTSADWNKIHNVGKIIYTLLIVLLQACEISQPI